MNSTIIAMLLLQIKHLIVDWCWQPPYEWQNKGTYGHFGGIRHAAKNAIGTALCFVPFVAVPALVAITLIDFVLHYHIDWAKMSINKALDLSPSKNAEFWYLTGFDQFLHQLTYLILIAGFIG